MGAVLLAAGAKGKRFALPNSEIMIHQVLGGFQGQATDIKIHAERILKVKDRLNEILARNTASRSKGDGRYRARPLHVRRRYQEVCD